MAHVVEKESKSPAKAKEVENTLFKIGIKAFFLVDAGKFKMKDVLVADAPLREAIKEFVLVRDYVYARRDEPEAIDKQRLRAKLDQCHELGRKAARLLLKVMSPHIKPKNTQRIQALVDYFTVDRLMTIVLDRDLTDDVWDLVEAAQQYSNFQYYVDD